MVRGCTSFIVNYLQLRGAGGGVGAENNRVSQLCRPESKVKVPAELCFLQRPEGDPQIPRKAPLWRLDMADGGGHFLSPYVHFRDGENEVQSNQVRQGDLVSEKRGTILP